MSTVKEIYDYIDSIAPFSSQEEWDNSGMLIGDITANVTKAIVVLDITKDAVDRAIELGANLIVSHHPVIFNAMKSFTKGSVPFEMAANSINAICCHTPLDIADGGTNDTLADILGIIVHKEENSILRFGKVATATADELAEKISQKLNCHVRYSDGGRKIENIAICTGSGCSLIPDAGNIDAFITGDAGHHDFIDAAENGITLIAAGHYETEILVVPIIAKKLSQQFGDIKVINIQQENPVKFC